MTQFSVFPEVANDQTKEPMFFGSQINLARYDQQKYPFFEDLKEKQLSFFWRPQEINITKDKVDFSNLLEHEKHIFVSNLRYQIILDSVQGRAPSIALLPICSIPELEIFIQTWAFSETVHSFSYSHIIRQCFPNPGEIFDQIVEDKDIKKRAIDVSKYYDDLIQDVNLYNTGGVGTYIINGEKREITLRSLKKKLFLCINSINALEAVRFFVSFLCTFSFAERNLMVGNANIMSLIARDEAIHLTATQYVLNIFKDPKEDPEMAEIAKECEEEAIKIFTDTVEQEKEWAKYLFKDGSMIGLTESIVIEYLEYIAGIRLRAIGYESPYNVKHNPCPWINAWLVSDETQRAPQEVEAISYTVGQIDSKVDESKLSQFEL